MPTPGGSNYKKRLGSLAQDSQKARMSLMDKYGTADFDQDLKSSTSGIRAIKPPHRIPKIHQAASVALDGSKISTANVSPTREDGNVVFHPPPDAA